MQERWPMVIRWCGHCQTEIEVPNERRIVCPICGLDPMLLPFAFEDAPAFFLADAAAEQVQSGRLTP
jgi:hypothetical protein